METFWLLGREDERPTSNTSEAKMTDTNDNPYPSILKGSDVSEETTDGSNAMYKKFLRSDTALILIKHSKKLSMVGEEETKCILLLKFFQAGDFSQSVSQQIIPKKKVSVGIAAVERTLPSNIGWSVCGGAIGMALDKLRENHLVDDFEFERVHNIEFYVNFTDCNSFSAVGVGIDFMRDKKVDVVIAPPCPETAIIMAHLSTIYQTTILGWGFLTSFEFSLAEKYPFITTIISDSQTLLAEFSWDNISILFTSNEVHYCDTIIEDTEATVTQMSGYFHVGHNVILSITPSRKMSQKHLRQEHNHLQTAINDPNTYTPDIVHKQQIISGAPDMFGSSLKNIKAKSRMALRITSNKLRRGHISALSELSIHEIALRPCIVFLVLFKVDFDEKANISDSRNYYREYKWTTKGVNHLVLWLLFYSPFVMRNQASWAGSVPLRDQEATPFLSPSSCQTRPIECSATIVIQNSCL
uniref:ANF_receptor domain-containing protein n=1 Tax=Heterorhabditis bacteriophora TaxID=37862 RepID=A0A1I7WI26_HETBA